jgi:voltage-gated potassium channel
VGMVGYALVTGTRFVVEGEMNKIITRRRHMRAIHRIRDHFIVCGFGRMGSFICHELHERGLPFVVVEQDPETQQKIIDLGYLMAPGDATEEEILLNAGIENARGLVAVLDRDADNVYAVLTAREVNSSLEIIARAADESAHKKLLRAGASRVISPYQIGGMRMLMSILQPTVTSFLEVVMDHRQLNIGIEEVRLGEHSAYDGKKLAETDIRKSLNLIVIAVRRVDGTMVFNPGSETVLNSHDTLIAMGQQEKLARFRKEANMENLAEG